MLPSTGGIFNKNFHVNTGQLTVPDTQMGFGAQESRACEARGLQPPRQNCRQVSEKYNGSLSVKLIRRWTRRIRRGLVYGSGQHVD